MTFLGRKLNGNFQGDLVTDQLDFSQLPRRLRGRRVKHRMKRNWIKMYNKEGSVLRVETVINQPDEFRIRRRVRRQGRHVMAWVPMRRASPSFPATARSARRQTESRRGATRVAPACRRRCQILELRSSTWKASDGQRKR